MEPMLKEIRGIMPSQVLGLERRVCVWKAVAIRPLVLGPVI
ncbi:unnamed protein product [Penicillium camemberti]|uniref:Str. FM013 n=1 Tax=Penicillium camemberti (strain FM 013) TaxID=1429867 RepID=A0A0G4PY29_PENC3|nr:unnamed protein product [Penicillium camemberti]